MFFAAMLISAVHAALKNAEIVFDGVGVIFAAHVFADTVIATVILFNSLIMKGFLGGAYTGVLSFSCFR